MQANFNEPNIRGQDYSDEMLGYDTWNIPLFELKFTFA